MEQAFFDYLKFEKRYSPHTLISYRTDMRQFREFLDKQEVSEPISKANSVLIRDWIVQLLEANISARSIGRKLSTLKSYFRFLKRQGERLDNPMQSIISPKTAKRLPEFVEQRKMSGLFDQEGLFADDFNGRRDRLIIQLFYSTGLRCAELVELTDTSFDKAGLSLKVLGKRNKERIVPLGPQITEMIETYLTIRNQAGLNHSSFLIVKDDGGQLYHRFVYRKVNLYLGKVTSMQKRSPHVLRHTFATHMLNNGADIHAIKEILGHSSLAATQVYTHNTIDKLKDIHKQAHPRG